jgi:hypothetical protein
MHVKHIRQSKGRELIPSNGHVTLAGEDAGKGPVSLSTPLRPGFGEKEAEKAGK